MRDLLLSPLGATLRPHSNKVGFVARVSGLSSMLGQHVLGAEGTDVHHPRSWLLGVQPSGTLRVVHWGHCHFVRGGDKSLSCRSVLLWDYYGLV